MSEEELVQQYLDGKVSRRLFMRRAMALGLSATAALTYAEMLMKAPAAAALARPQRKEDREPYDRG